MHRARPTNTMTTTRLQSIQLLRSEQAPAGRRRRQCCGHRAIAGRLALSLLPLPLVALAGPVLPVAVSLWLAVGLAWARGATPIKLLEIGAAVTLGSLALVTLAP